MARKTTKPTDIVTLADLAPRRAIVGGSERRVFGATAHPNDERAAAPGKTTKDLPAKKPVKGGRLAGNDNLTLVRNGRPRHGCPPAHTPPVHEHSTSQENAHGFQEGPPREEDRQGRPRPRIDARQGEPMASKKDLSTKKSVKGGRLGANDNVTLVRNGRRRHR